MKMNKIDYQQLSMVDGQLSIVSTNTLAMVRSTPNL